MGPHPQGPLGTLDDRPRAERLPPHGELLEAFPPLVEPVQIPPRAGPQDAVVVREERVDDAGGLVAPVEEDRHTALEPAAEPALGAHPEAAVGGGRERLHAIVRQPVDVGQRGRPRPAETADAVVVGADPEGAVHPPGQRGDAAARAAAGDRHRLHAPPPPPGEPVLGADPQGVRRAPEERQDALSGAGFPERPPLAFPPAGEPAVEEPRPHPPVLAGGEGLHPSLPLDQGEAHAVEAHQAGAGPEPEIAVPAGSDGAHRRLREPLGVAPTVRVIALQRSRRVEPPGGGGQKSAGDQSPQGERAHKRFRRKLGGV